MTYQFINGKKNTESTFFFVYILLCDNDSLYTGYTSDITRRYQEHLTGRASAKYTRSFKPLRIMQCWQVSTKSAAMKIERHIKKLSRPEKQKLISCPAALCSYFKEQLIKIMAF